jgi:dTDP-glucose 4,6-dehydratase
MKILVTGGAGFIGSNFILFMLETYSDAQITNLDKLTYAGNLENLSAVERTDSFRFRYRFIKGDISYRELIDNLLSQGFDECINFAAESHVDRSIEDAGVFIQTNIGAYRFCCGGKEI